MGKSAAPPAPAASPDLEAYRVRESAGHLLRRAHQVAVSIYGEEVESDLLPRQFTTLIALHQEPGLLQVELTDRIGADRSTISELVSRLEKRGLVERRRPEDGDERIAGLYVTEAGAAALAGALPGAARVHDRILALLPEHLHAPFLEALRHIENAGQWNRGRLDTRKRKARSASTDDGSGR